MRSLAVNCPLCWVGTPPDSAADGRTDLAETPLRTRMLRAAPKSDAVPSDPRRCASGAHRSAVDLGGGPPSGATSRRPGAQVALVDDDDHLVVKVEVAGEQDPGPPPGPARWHRGTAAGWPRRRSAKSRPSQAFSSRPSPDGLTRVFRAAFSAVPGKFLGELPLIALGQRGLEDGAAEGL